MEVWVNIEDYPNYEVSSEGQVRSYQQNNPRILKQKINKDGYCAVTLCNENGKKMYNVHRLVAKGFIANLSNKPDVDHINRIRTDNKISNLRWATKQEQCYNKVFQTNTGEEHISMTLKYDVSFYRDKKAVFRKGCSTLEEAIDARDTFLTEHPEFRR
jgi:hypothetical protein